VSLNLIFAAPPGSYLHNADSDANPRRRKTVIELEHGCEFNRFMTDAIQATWLGGALSRRRLTLPVPPMGPNLGNMTKGN
jgi:hypothetical protein